MAVIVHLHQRGTTVAATSDAIPTAFPHGIPVPKPIVMRHSTSRHHQYEHPQKHSPRPTCAALIVIVVTPLVPRIGMALGIVKANALMARMLQTPNDIGTRRALCTYLGNSFYTRQPVLGTQCIKERLRCRPMQRFPVIDCQGGQCVHTGMTPAFEFLVQ